MLTVLLHGEEEAESITHKINEWAADLVLIGVPILFIVILTIIIWKINQPPKGRHHKVDNNS